jgi:hypothetical protein
MRNRRRTRLLRRLVLGLAIVAVAAPVAQARIYEGGVAPSDEAVQGVPTRADDKVGLDVWQLAGVSTRADDKVGLLPSTSPRLVAHPDNRADRTGPGFDATVDVTLIGHPDNRADRTGPGFEGTAGAEDNHYVYRGYLPSDYGQPNKVIVVADSTGDGFDWGDAGIGAGTLFGVVLLAAAGIVATRHLSRPATA